jgi:hypothetical protein
MQQEQTMRLIPSLLVLGGLAGCAAQPPQGRYTNESATQEQFIGDRSECIRQATQPRSGAITNGYGGAADSSAVVSCAMWLACMDARHYRPDANGSLRASWTTAVSCKN